MISAVPERLPLVDCCTPLAGSTLSDEQAAELERLLQVIAERSRLRILNIVSEAAGAPVCVCELASELGLTQPTISYHLKQLVEAGLLARERRGRFAYFSLVPGSLDRLQALIAVPARRRDAA